MSKKLLFRLAVLVAAMMCALGAAAAEAYACYTSTNTTLTFYYDNYRSSRTGTTYDLNTDDNDTGWETDGTNYDVTQVVFDPSFAGARPTTTCDWFYGMWNLESITGMSYLNTSEVTNMNWMFTECCKLTSLDVSHFNTSKVTYMSKMFADCEKLTSLDLSSFNTANVTNMTGMFDGCSALTSLDVSGFNTSNVTYMSYMFHSCSALTSLDVSGFNTSKVTDMRYMFAGSSNLRTIYVGSGWSTAAVTNSTNMFNNCTSLVGGQGTTYNASYVDKTYAHIDGGSSNPGYFTDINAARAYACYTSTNTTLTFYYDNQRSSRTGVTYDLNTDDNDTGWDTDGTKTSVTKVVFNSSFASARPTTTCDWFYGMTNLESITGMEYLNTSEVTNMDWMFLECSKLTSVDVSHFNTSKVTSMYSMFNSCTGLTSLDLSSFNTSQVTHMTYMFKGCTNLQTIYVGNGWSTAAVTGSANMFNNCTSLVGGQGTTYNASYVDKTYAHIDGGSSNPGYFTEKGPEAYACYTSTNTTLTFYYDDQRSSRPGTTYDLNTGENYPGWYTDGTNADVTQVVFDPSFSDALPVSTHAWFRDMRILTSITNIENLNTSSVTNMGRMFMNCNYLTSIDVSHFDTNNVTNMQNMFFNCYRLTDIDLSKFNTSLVTNMRAMFQDCMSITSMDLSSFNTANVNDMRSMFSGCDGLTSLDLTSFNTANVTRTGSMFSYSNALTTIYVGSGWSTAAVTSSSDMFYNCTSLVGGQGTAYSSSNPTDKTYAHIDGGPSNPGYFTEKPAFQRGDVNGDGSVTISDVTALIDLLLGGGTINNPAADCNGDSNVTISDVTALIDYLLGGNW